MLRRRFILTGLVSIGAVTALLATASLWGQTSPGAPPTSPPVVAEPSPTAPDDLADTGTPGGTTDPGTPPTNPPTTDPGTPTAPVVQVRPPVRPPTSPPANPPASPPANPPASPPSGTTTDPLAVAPAAARIGPRTIVSLTFDDSNAGLVAGAGILANNGLKATYYTNSGLLGQPGKLTLAQLRAIAAQGNEVGGHTVTHPDLITLPADEVKRQVCNDRFQLAQWGFSVRNFAYPFATTNAGVEQIVADCGYNSARMLGDIRSRFGCGGCAYAETTPPADPFATKALDEFDRTWRLQDLKNGVTNAEQHGGGWVQFTFHDICTTSCDELAITQTMLNDFASWLKTRSLTFNTDVRTVGDVIGGAVKPVIMGPAAPPPGSGNNVVNPGLETMANGVPACWSQASWGTNNAAYSLVNPGHTGSVASRIVITNYTSGEGKIIPTLDLGGCAPSVLEGHQYSMRGWYTSTANTQFAVYLRTTTGGWVYWTSSPWFGAASAYTLASWTTPAIPPGYTGISFGLSLFSVGVLTTDDYELFDVASAPPVVPPAPPTQVVNPSLETMSNGVPACWTSAGWGDNNATFSVVNPGRTGNVAGQISITNYVSGEGKLIPTLDLGTCAPSVTTGHTYQLNGWYKSSAVTQFAVYLRTTAGAWQYWTSSPWFGAASQYTQASWTTPAIPAGFTGISFGLNIFSTGTIVTDDYSMTDVTPAAPPQPLAVQAAPPAQPAEAPAVAPVVTDPPAATPAQDPPVTEQPPASPGGGEGSAPPVEPAPDPAPAVEPAVPPAP